MISQDFINSELLSTLVCAFCCSYFIFCLVKTLTLIFEAIFNYFLNHLYIKKD